MHARPDESRPGAEIELDRGRFRTLAVPHEALATPFAISFEEGAAAIERLERMYFEPDGSFVWASGQNDLPKWQVEGNLFDRGGRLLFVDLKGSCPGAEFDRFLSALGWPGTCVMFQLARAAVFLDEAEFRRYAGLGG
jgi:hypothetical protein